jgi:hypothetical protein
LTLLEGEWFFIPQILVSQTSEKLNVLILLTDYFIIVFIMVGIPTKWFRFAFILKRNKGKTKHFSGNMHGAEAFFRFYSFRKSVHYE